MKNNTARSNVEKTDGGDKSAYMDRGNGVLMDGNDKEFEGRERVEDKVNNDGAQEVHETSDVEEVHDKESDREGAAKRGDNSAIVDSGSDVLMNDNDDLDEGEVVSAVVDDAGAEANKNTHEKKIETYDESEFQNICPL
jgi:hypothetical protein